MEKIEFKISHNDLCKTNLLPYCRINTDALVILNKKWWEKSIGISFENMYSINNNQKIQL